jgi:pyrroline-5-carboxylate reductase
MQHNFQSELKVGFIGGGNMASALIAGLANRLTAGGNIHVVDLNADALQKLAQQYGVSSATAIDAALAHCDVIVLAVKPQQMRQAVEQLAGVLQTLAPSDAQPLVLSIAAGIRGCDLSRWLGGYGAVVRCMPNTPALIGQGITGMAALPAVSNAQRAAADAIMCAVGVTVWLDDESLIDAVTAVSGSGPAYVFYFIEAMQQAGEQLGLTPQQALQLSLATFNGASQLAAQSTEPIALLRERVTSKGGTTHAALTSLEQGGVKAAIVEAIKAAAERGRELGDEFGR